MKSRHGSVYLAVVATVSAVTILTLSGIALRKSFNERARSGSASIEARRLATSASELAIHTGYTDAETFWKNALGGTLFDKLELGSGSISATVTDAETGALPVVCTEQFRVIADASVHQARSRLAFTLREDDSDLTKLIRELGGVAYWPLDECTGESVAEDVVSTFDGSYNDPSRAGLATHKHGNPAPRYDWPSQRVTVPHASDFELSKGTIVFWAYWDSLPTIPFQAGGVSKELPSSNASAHLAVYLAAGGKLFASLNNQYNNGGTVEASGVITAGRWHHIAFSWRNKLELFVDGVEVAETYPVYIGLASGGPVAANTAPWMFGVRNKAFLTFTPAYQANGSIARVALFDTDLSSSNIARLYAASSAPGTFVLEPGSFARVTD